MSVLSRKLQVTHAPRGLQLVAHLGLAEDGVAGQAAHTTSSAANGRLTDGGDTAAVASYAASITHSIIILELARRSEVQASEGARFTQQMPIISD